jgi:hypothetical protein
MGRSLPGTRRERRLIILRSDGAERDPDGRVRHIGVVNDKRIRIVLALENQSIVVSVHERRR